MQWTAQRICVSLAALLIVALATIFHWRRESSTASGHKRAVAETVTPAKTETKKSEVLLISSGDTLGELLVRAGIDKPVVGQITEAIDTSFDVRSFRAGSQLLLTRSGTGVLEQIEYSIDPDRKLTIVQNGGAFASAVVEIPSIVRAVPVCGRLEGSLFESIESLGERPELAIQIAEIFAWDIDFYTDPQPGDEFCLVVEKKEYANGQPPGYGRILGARYNNTGALYEAFLFADAHGKDAWFSPDGRSLQSAFLRSPLKFEARVSSRFSRRRFHPVLKTYRPHLGTDYAAPAGTPVQTVADGRVVFSGRSRGAGNLVQIRHAQGFDTYYMHLSRRLVRRGQRVQQGQRIGLVGSTGLATGPHLDFRIKRNGHFQDFEKLRAPKKSRIDSRRLAQFQAVQQQYAAMMTAASPSVIAARAAAGDSGLVR